MSTLTITREQLDEVTESAEIWEEGGVRTDYSGRGMYGRTCVGFVVDRFTDVLRIGVALNEVLGTLPHAREDSMGTSRIVYFPYLTVADA